MPSAGAGGAGRVPGMLASHDGGDDAAIEHADGLYDRACRSATATPTCGSRSVPGGLCPGLDGVRERFVSGRYADPLAGASLVLARHPYLGGWCDHLCGRGGVPVQSAQGALSQAVPQPFQLLHALLPPGSRSRLAHGAAPLHVLPGLLLRLDAGHVWDRGEQPAVDGAADGSHGCREDLSGWTATQPADWDRLAGLGGPLAGSSCPAPGWLCGLTTFLQPNPFTSKHYA